MGPLVEAAAVPHLVTFPFRRIAYATGRPGPFHEAGRVAGCSWSEVGVHRARPPCGLRPQRGHSPSAAHSESRTSPRWAPRAGPLRLCLAHDVTMACAGAGPLRATATGTTSWDGWRPRRCLVRVALPRLSTRSCQQKTLTWSRRRFSRLTNAHRELWGQESRPPPCSRDGLRRRSGEVRLAHFLSRGSAVHRLVHGRRSQEASACRPAPPALNRPSSWGSRTVQAVEANTRSARGGMSAKRRPSQDRFPRTRSVGRCSAPFRVTCLPKASPRGRDDVEQFRKLVHGTAPAALPSALSLGGQGLDHRLALPRAYSMNSGRSCTRSRPAFCASSVRYALTRSAVPSATRIGLPT